jgi:hypothetical protein
MLLVVKDVDALTARADVYDVDRSDESSGIRTDRFRGSRRAVCPGWSAKCVVITGRMMS